MEIIGVKELRDNLSAILQKVENGEIVTIQRHGKGIAELRPQKKSEAVEAVLNLKRKGLLDGGSGVIPNTRRVKNRQPAKPISDMIIEDRR
jgi:antitoxin (DNA-binding transcriptional repressor) of toxin-antitoxin stability system